MFSFQLNETKTNTNIFKFNCLVGWGRTQPDPSFGSTYDSTSVKARSVNLINSVRTVARGRFMSF